MSDQDEYEDLKTIHETALHFRVDDSTVRRWIKNGKLEGVSLPRRGKRQVFRVKPSSIRKFDPSYQG